MRGEEGKAVRGRTKLLSAAWDSCCSAAFRRFASAIQSKVSGVSSRRHETEGGEASLVGRGRLVVQGQRMSG
jgi:hypothetical protein